ncbi:hypothetical protein CATYP_09820 [Corynebacterium atypicum]|uniref:YoaR-like putative peptidoglycan binding domain-containing protein n=2 Tax=Corynebacterium atypicum TaxID=191610 RepID=A0ABM5QPN0_9CORY|nr:hypothetical protein CATYP_09820 [Corynebacterium atypicum]
MIIGLMSIAAVGYLVDYLATRGDVPRGAQVGGVDIGGMSPQEARATLDTELGDLAVRPVTVSAEQMSARFTPAEAGITPDWEATVAAAGEQSANPFTRLRGLITTYEVDIVSATDDARFSPALQRMGDSLSREPVDAQLRLEGGRVVTDAPVDGQQVDRKQLGERMISGWARPGGISVDAAVTPPAIDDAALRKAAEGPAAKAVSAPVMAHGREGTNGVIPTARMGEVVTFAPEDGKLATHVDHEAVRGMLAEGLAGGETPKKNAQVSFAGGGKSVTPHSDGVTVDWDKTLDGIDERITGSKDREFDAEYRDEPATYTTEMAQNATFDDVVGEFTTGGFSATSGTNIRRVAEQVNGAFIAPGDTFSLNGYTGPRGIAQGYVEGGIIIDGHAGKAVGGGISQFATTLYNASYFAGMGDIAHTPHSYYISRYPAGREATVYEGAIDLVFKNTLRNPVIIETSVSGDSVTVRLKGVKEVQVESISGGRWAQTEPKPKAVPGPNCAPSSGAPGFTTSDTRVVRDLSGNELSRETTTTVYDPQPIVRCG